MSYIQELTQFIEEANYDQNVDPEGIRILLQRTIEWTKNEAPKNFDESFIHNLYTWFHEGRGLTQNQVKALVNIVKGFEIQ